MSGFPIPPKEESRFQFLIWNRLELTPRQNRPSLVNSTRPVMLAGMDYCYKTKKPRLTYFVALVYLALSQYCLHTPTCLIMGFGQTMGKPVCKQLSKGANEPVSERVNE